MYKGGRPKGKMWDELSYILTKGDNGKNAALCTVCKTVISNTAEVRLQMHRRKCLLVAADPDDMEVDKTQDSEISRMSVTDDTLDSYKLHVINEKQLDGTYLNNNTIDQLKIPSNSKIYEKKKEPSKSVVGRQRRMNPFIDIVNEKEKATIDEALANFFIGCNVEFDIVESDYFKSFIKILRPGYILPKSVTVASDFVDKAFEKFSKRRNNYENLPGILYFIMKEHNNSTHLISFMNDLNGEPVFLKSFQLNVKNSDEEISNIVLQGINFAKSAHFLDVFAVISKEAVAKTDDFPDVLLLRCNTKLADFVAESLEDVSLFRKASDVFDECLQSDYLSQNIVYNINKGSSESSNVKSWVTHFQVYSFFLQNVKMLRKIAGESEHKFDSDITKLIFDHTLESEVKTLFENYLSVASLISNFEKKDCWIGDVVENWINFRSSSKSILITLFLDKSWNEIMHPVCLTANLLHPEYRGLKLNDDQLTTTYDFLLDYINVNGLDQLAAYKEGRGIFSKLFEKNITSPIAFWSVAERESPELAEFALKILKIPAASLDFQCNYSQYKNLSNDQSEKCTSLYYDLRIRDSKQSSCI